MYAWKKFQFFTKEELKIPPPEGGEPPKQSLQSIRDTCADCGRGCLVLGDAEGMVHFIRGGWRWQSYRAYEKRVTHVHQLRTRDAVVAVGDDNVVSSLVSVACHTAGPLTQSVLGAGGHGNQDPACEYPAGAGGATRARAGLSDL
jgi:hypothetical protein